MATVPLYQRTERLRPINRQGVNVQATPGDFGAQIGQGMQSLAQGLGDVGDAIATVNEMKDRSVAKQTGNSYLQAKTDLLYGPQGYFNLSGQNALDQRDGFQRDLKRLKDQAAAKLSPSQRRMFTDFADASDISDLEGMARHAGNEFKRQVIADSDATAANFLDQALLKIDDPKAADKYLAAGIQEVKEKGRNLGWTADILDQAQRNYLSDATKKATLILANKPGTESILKAKAYMDANVNRLSAVDRAILDDALKSPLTAAKAQQHFSGIVSGAPIQRYDTGDVSRPTSGTGAVDLSSMPKPLSNVLGQLTGLNEDANPTAISTFIKNATGTSIDPRTTAWCAAFANAVLATQGIEGTGKLNARSFLNFGMPTDKPQPGDIVVFRRGNDPSLGHVSFFSGYDKDGNIKAVGGNQGDSVKESTYSAAAVLAFRTAGKVDAQAVSMPNYSPEGLGYMYEQLQQIGDPDEREATRKLLDSHFTMQKKIAEAAKDRTEMWATQQIINDPKTNPTDFPVQIQQALGAGGMTTMMNFREKVLTQGQPTTDDRVMYDLQTQFANDPTAFGRVDLFQYRDKLSNTDWDKVTGWRQSALNDTRKAVEDGSIYSSAFKQSEQALASAGLTTSGLGSTDDVKARATMEGRIAKFQNELRLRIDDYRNQNDGKAPTYADREGMISELLRGVVYESPNWWGGTSPDEGHFLFEVPTRPDGTAFKITVPYQDIPIDFRQRITTTLQTAHGRKPTQEEVVDRYVQFLTGKVR